MATGPGGNQLSKRWHYTPSEARVFVSAAGTGTREHLNSKRLPNDALAKTDFSYLTTNGTVDAPYLDASKPGGGSNGAGSDG